MKMPSSSSARCGSGNGKQVWPPGFRFHPTDEELVLYYLKRKVCGRRLKLDIIAETDVYKWDPEDLPGLSKLKTGDRLWFFFSPRDRKYPNGGRANRATHHGYWKATGKDRHITCNSRSVGMKKTLVFYEGRAPTGTRTDWVMHEYILDEEELKRCKNVGDYYALYKLYKKSGPGPKNGEQYGAPFKEEDWADEECVEVGFNAVEASIISETPLNFSVVEASIISETPLNFSVVEASKISEPLETRRTALVRFDSDLNGLLDENNGVERTSKEIPDLCQLESADFSDSFPQTFGHEAQSTIYDPSGTRPLSIEQGPYAYSSSQQYDTGNSFDYSLPAASQVAETSDINSGIVTSDPGIDELNKFLDDGDFFEANDLLGPETFPSVEENLLTNIKFDDTYDGLGEWDLFDDASMFLHDTAANDVNSMFDGDNGVVNHLVHQMQPQLGDASFTTDELWGYDNQYQDRPSGFPSGSINGGSGDSSITTLHVNQNHNDSSSYPQNRVTSALWDFIESIPTTPASASENILFSKALERISSFRRTRQSVIDSPIMKASSKSRRLPLLLFSIVGALCAMLWIFMTKTTVTRL